LEIQPGLSKVIDERRGTSLAAVGDNATGAKPRETLTPPTVLSRFCAAWIQSGFKPRKSPWIERSTVVTSASARWTTAADRVPRRDHAPAGGTTPRRAFTR